MIKDIVVNLSLHDSRDVTMDFAVFTAAAFNAHLAGIAFVYHPFVPVMVDMYGVPGGVIESQRIENEKAAHAAVARFDEAARRSALSAEARGLEVPVSTAPGVFAQMARRFDLSILGQPAPDKPELDRLIVEAALFDTGRPVLVVPYIQKAALKLDHVMLCWDGSALRPAPPPTPCRSWCEARWSKS